MSCARFSATWKVNKTNVYAAKTCGHSKHEWKNMHRLKLVLCPDLLYGNNDLTIKNWKLHNGNMLTVVTVTAKNCGGSVPIMFVTVWRIASTT